MAKAKKKQVTLATVKKEVRRIYGVGDDDDSEAFQAGVVLLSSAFLGPHVGAIAKFTKITEDTVCKFASNLERGGVWRAGKVYADWFKKDGGVAFLCDTLVAQGMLQRS